MPITVHHRRPELQAVQYLPGTNCDELAAFLGKPVHPPGQCDPDADLTIPPWGGTTTAHPGDWLLRAPGGELFPCPADMFAATYEPT